MFHVVKIDISFWRAMGSKESEFLPPSVFFLEPPSAQMKQDTMYSQSDIFWMHLLWWKICIQYLHNGRFNLAVFWTACYRYLYVYSIYRADSISTIWLTISFRPVVRLHLSITCNWFSESGFSECIMHILIQVYWILNSVWPELIKFSNLHNVHLWNLLFC